ncbi:sensor histidine kinase [Paenibacillus sp. UMB4589-SE434]|uniref:sensor histidine kinase n=1 Tax=Paenibacillus sp. UMB4589-SE434 TaxID=3046314 RepID=UPI00254DBB13|nr:sensor histidine kinase [Paenibacillus sp. UMB4589-SE434]MDK8183319.1 sensor histidine kinase [Paenibacillus sp. UMB4589-SE434]
MQKWYQIFHRNTGLSPYVWVVFYILPFYFIFRASSTYEVVIGIVMIVAFFICYMLSFVSKGWLVYFWTSLQIIISVTMTMQFGYVYFSLFLAFFIGNIQHWIGFVTLYSIHLVTTVVTINVGFVTKNSLLITQLPFVLVSLIGVILLPVTTYNRNKRDKLQGQLEDANKRISELVKLEERQRIARDLHDTLGQKLSLIGLKSDLAGKLISKNPAQAQVEINDVRQTARSALKEVREMVTQMRGTRLEDEMFRIKQILKAAEIEFTMEGDEKLSNTSLLNENVLSMCLKEAVTNIVKHSSASTCSIMIQPSRTELCVKVQDNGIGIASESPYTRGNGLRGMKERLEFVNGCMEIHSDRGTTVIIKVPNVFKQPEEEGSS